jgi:hypothetical protein
MPTARFTSSLNTDRLREMQLEALEYQLETMRNDAAEMTVRVRAAESILRHSAKILSELEDASAAQMDIFDPSDRAA